MTETKIKVVKLNPDIGYYLLTFLNGIDACNFLEVVSKDDQFWSMTITPDQLFYNLMKMLGGDRRILLDREMYEEYLDECEVIDDKLVLIEKHDYPFTRPIQRLFIYTCFSVEGFGKLCKAYRTTLFQCYSRMLPFNTDLYYADFGLLDYELYSQTICSPRDLNNYERKLFKTNTYFYQRNNQFSSTEMLFVSTLAQFRTNLETRFLSTQWLDAIDFSKFTIVGGCVVNVLCQSPFPDTKQQDINLIYSSHNAIDFEIAVAHAVTKLKAMTPGHLKHEIKVEKNLGSPHYDVFIPCGIRLNFLYTLEVNSKNPLSHILHNFDMDICQVAFTGNKIISTFAFLQALATKSFIVYSLHAKTPKNVCTRITKYCERGFTLLEPINFDGDFDILMKQADVPMYRAEHREIIDDNGEIQSVTTEYRRRPARNIDTFQLQEAFITVVHQQSLELNQP